MKLRALPQSFWQQPNLANPLSPGAVYSRLPPLPGQTAAEDTADLLAADHVPPLHEVAGEAAEHTLRCGDIESLISGQLKVRFKHVPLTHSSFILVVLHEANAQGAAGERGQH